MGNLKKLIIAMLIMAPFCGHAIKMSGKHYQGIAKNTEGDPIEFWVNVEFDDEDAEVNIGEVYSFMAPYKVSGTDKNATISTKLPGFGTPLDFKTTDGGSTLTALFSAPHKNVKMNLWLLRVPRKLKKTALPTEQVVQTVTSSDGYTCFMEFKRGDSDYCITSEAALTPDGKFKINQDSPKLREMFDNQLDGKFSVDGGNITLSISGRTFSGEIYDDGKYIKIPLGRLPGLGTQNDVTLILIR